MYDYIRTKRFIFGSALVPWSRPLLVIDGKPISYRIAEVILKCPVRECTWDDKHLIAHFPPGESEGLQFLISIVQKDGTRENYQRDRLEAYYRDSGRQCWEFNSTARLMEQLLSMPFP